MATAIGGVDGNAEPQPDPGTGGFGRDLIEMVKDAARLRDMLAAILLGPKSDDDLGLILRTALAATMVGVALQLISALLQVPGGWGIEDFLGWVDVEIDAPGQAIIKLWAIAGVRSLADLYLALDTLLFVPAYAVMLLVTGSAIARRLAFDSTEDLNRLGPTARNWRTLLAIPTFALISADLGENVFGIVRLAPSSFEMLLVLIVPASVILVTMSLLRKTLLAVKLPVVLGGIVLAVLVCGLSAGIGDQCKAPLTAPHWVMPYSIGCGFHRGKFYLLGMVALVIVICAGLWLFAVLADRNRSDLRQQRAELRSAIWDIFVRSRYVLATLILFIGLVLGLDQAQDVMYAVASAPWPTLQAESDLWGWAGTLLVYVLAATSVWSLSFACWLWSRSVCIVVAPGRAARSMPGPADLIARHWARLLGLVPYGVVFLLCESVIVDSTRASYAALLAKNPTDAYFNIILSVVTFSITTVLLGLVYVRIRVANSEPLYYNADDWRIWAFNADFLGGWQRGGKFRKYRLLGFVTPYMLPFVALVGMFACRAVDIYPSDGIVPSMAFPVIVFTLTMWLCFFGWLSMLEVVRAIPWVLLLLVLVGVLGVLGYSDNQRVWLPIVGGSGLPEPWIRYRMLAFSGALAVIALAAYVIVMRVARSERDISKLAIIRWWLLLIVLVATVMWLGDQYASYRNPKTLDGSVDSPDKLKRPTLAQAMSDWLMQVCSDHEKQGCSANPTNVLKPAVPLPVYFVSTIGGGIRAAVWTAQVLRHLEEADRTFMRRTFSISGVSGGAVGAAVYRACGSGKSMSRNACIDSFADADLVSPLLSAWLFEDVLAKLIPTQWCGTSACGFLSRGAWFEGSMEAVVPDLRQGLSKSRSARGVFEPYLLLNATWVETGERAIASDLQIHSVQFPGAKDQLAIAGHDLPLGTAAHNAARFPYVNAIGQLTAPSAKCDMRDDDALHADEQGVRGINYGERIGCGHLADGGYFDNTGGQSSVDALHAMVRCLLVTETSADRELYLPCVELPAKQRDWLRRSLVPTVVFIRNGVTPEAESACDCSRADWPTATELADQTKHQCGSRGLLYRPEQTACRRNFTFYVDVLGPPIALINGAGTGAHGRLSEAGQRRAVIDARAALAASEVASVASVMSCANAPPSGAASSVPSPREMLSAALDPVVTLDQTPDGVRYPLGWHLSRAAVDGLEKQACALKGIMSYLSSGRRQSN